jgi:hypothetical protein
MVSRRAGIAERRPHRIHNNHFFLFRAEIALASSSSSRSGRRDERSAFYAASFKRLAGQINVAIHVRRGGPRNAGEQAPGTLRVIWRQCGDPPYD